MVPLFELNEGEVGEVVEISDEYEKPGWWHRKNGRHCRHEKYCCKHARICDMGIRVGKNVTMLSKQRWGPLLVKVDDFKIAIGRSMAERIKIKDPQ